MSEDLILNDRGVGVDIDVLDGDGGDFGNHDSAEGVCEGGVEADEVEFGCGVGEGVNLDLEVLFKRRRGERGRYRG
jgi:hypothetical protein